jgi:hypothetical protein
MAVSFGGYLRLHGVIDVSVDILLADAAEDAVARERLADGQLERDPLCCWETWRMSLIMWRTR